MEENKKEVITDLVSQAAQAQLDEAVKSLEKIHYLVTSINKEVDLMGKVKALKKLLDGE